MKNIEDLWSCYLWNIHYIINTLNCTWEFKGMEKIEKFPFYISDLKRSDFINPYLTNYIDDSKKLVNNILNNGMYFPFFMIYTISDDYMILLGKHRLIALRDYYIFEKKISNKFLFIDFPIKFNRDKNSEFLLPLNKKHEIYRYANQIKYLNNYPEIIYCLDKYGTEMAEEIYQYEKKNNIKISSNFILNNEEAFLKFINNPYKLNGKISKVKEENINANYIGRR